MTEILLRKELGGLRPASDDAYRVLGNIKTGAEMVVNVPDPSRRSNAQHSFWFALVNTMFESQDQFKTMDHFRKRMLIALGYCEVYKSKDGPDVVIANSVSFGRMSQDKFNGLVEDTLNVAEAMGFNRDSLLAMTRERAA